MLNSLWKYHIYYNYLIHVFLLHKVSFLAKKKKKCPLHTHTHTKNISLITLLLFFSCTDQLTIMQKFEDLLFRMMFSCIFGIFSFERILLQFHKHGFIHYEQIPLANYALGYHTHQSRGCSGPPYFLNRYMIFKIMVILRRRKKNIITQMQIT